MTVGAIYTSHKNVTAILKTAFFSVAHVAMLASLSLTILVSTTEALKALTLQADGRPLAHVRLSVIISS